MAKKIKKGETEVKPGIAARVRKYFEELKFEWLKITFPSKKELTQSTIVVFLFTLVLMVIISLYDLLMSLAFTKWILPTPPTSV